MNIPFTGGCKCGAIRYECSAAPIVMENCHCRDCQQATGTAYAAVIFVPSNTIQILGDAKYYDSIGDNGGIVSRGFCPTCGSPTFIDPKSYQLRGVTASSLDEPNGFEPAMDIFTKSALKWDYMNPELPKFHTAFPTA